MSDYTLTRRMDTMVNSNLIHLWNGFKLEKNKIKLQCVGIYM